jgi:hypothetical protein
MDRVGSVRQKAHLKLTTFDDPLETVRFADITWCWQSFVANLTWGSVNTLRDHVTIFMGRVFICHGGKWAILSIFTFLQGSTMIAVMTECKQTEKNRV